MATSNSSPSVFWGSGDRRREGGAFSFSVRVVAAALFQRIVLGCGLKFEDEDEDEKKSRGVMRRYFVRRNFNASSMSAGMGAVNFTFLPVRGCMNASLCAWSKTRGAS